MLVSFGLNRGVQVKSDTGGGVHTVNPGKLSMFFRSVEAEDVWLKM